jgi:hypothetical protein
MDATKWIALAAAAAMLTVGCRQAVFFPLEPLAGSRRAFDTDGDGRGDFFERFGRDGRIRRIAYDDDADGNADAVIDLDAIGFDRCRHLVIILDGFGYEVVAACYEAGGLRMFHPPARVIAPYPTLTDPALEDVLGYVPCPAMEAKYYSRRAGRVVGGNRAYLAGTNQPYNRLLHYRAGLLWDAIGYLWPTRVFGKELNDAKRLFDRRRTQEVLAYFVSSAGISTRRGAAGQRAALRRVEQLVNQVLWETRGLTKVTLLADHGHSYTEGRRARLDAHLKARGWRLTARLRGPNDVAYIRFGLETYASFATDSPERLAADLAAAEAVELVSFADGDRVVVLGAGGGRAVVHRRGRRYRYQAVRGDPLALKPLLDGLEADANGTIDADALLTATADHRYPAPLQRLWRAHFALVENPPDVIVSLADGYYSGSGAFSRAVTVASTHGGLNRANSTTFIMSTIGPLPPVMRSADVPANMRRLIGRPWPTGR